MEGACGPEVAGRALAPTLPAPHPLCRLESVGFAGTFFSRPAEVVGAERIFYQEVKSGKRFLSVPMAETLAIEQGKGSPAPSFSTSPAGRAAFSESCVVRWLLQGDLCGHVEEPLQVVGGSEQVARGAGCS